MGRYYDPDAETLGLVEEVISERFVWLQDARIKVIMDGKEKISKVSGTVEFANIKKPNDVENFLADEVDDEEGFDYFIFIHKMVWELASPANKKRIISHELQHAVMDDKGNYKIRDHEVQDFYAEIQFNNDDPRWSQVLGELVHLTYDQRKEDGQL